MSPGMGAHISMGDAFEDPRSTQKALSEATFPRTLSSAGRGGLAALPTTGGNMSFPGLSEAA